MEAADNNKAIKLLVDGEEAFSRIIARIREAKESIIINMFIWRDDKIGNIIAQELLEAADRGVRISIVKDKLGVIFEKAEENKQSFFHKEFSFGLCLKTLAIDLMYPMKGKTLGYKQRFNPLVHKILKHNNINIINKIVRRDHSKYYIFDESILILGGMNIEDKTLYTDVEGKKYNDYMVELKGKDYVEIFNGQLNNGTIPHEKSFIEFIFNIKRNDEIIFEAKRRLLEILSSARESIDIMMAYIGDRDITKKIIECVNSGITINMLVPGKSNVQHDSNMKILKYIMKKTDNRINLYLSSNMVHAKFIRIDNKVVTLGSANLNRQAMERLLELNVMIKNYDEDFSKALDCSIKRNISSSKRISEGSKIKLNPLRAILEQMV